VSSLTSGYLLLIVPVCSKPRPKLTRLSSPTNPYGLPTAARGFLIPFRLPRVGQILVYSVQRPVRLTRVAPIYIRDPPGPQCLTPCFIIFPTPPGPRKPRMSHRKTRLTPSALLVRMGLTNAHQLEIKLIGSLRLLSLHGQIPCPSRDCMCTRGGLLS